MVQGIQSVPKGPGGDKHTDRQTYTQTDTHINTMTRPCLGVGQVKRELFFMVKPSEEKKLAHQSNFLRYQMLQSIYQGGFWKLKAKGFLNLVLNIAIFLS